MSETPFDLALIGIGIGNPDHLTFEGAAAMRNADLIIIPRKGEDKADLADLRREICARVLDGAGTQIAEFDLPTRDADGDYLSGVSDWHDAIAAVWTETIASAAPRPKKVALLIWGDPSLYDSSLRIAARLDPQPSIRVIPGITALQALCAAHRIPFNDVGAPVLVTTGRRLRERGWPADADTVAVMLDGACAFQSLDPGGLTIWWGAYLGMDGEMLFSGPLSEVGPDIVATRAEAREERGWIMDIYLIRKLARAG
ncbi:precorrin-6A synthase [Rhodobium orientis]|uniref:Precorrin-6A synthase [deacetylating] n=1 Tax=Rhodobium orientis TaxID=34017 RepID=A0A327JM30_9HYPH|nr:precorrin-6A synthase (deacetylating) [Rhodobium orientis]MBB4304767.1 precorrin-6A synthase [Rhodobium orientis]MBK5947865.1 precorrin-6A synthase (deacetylating) [Rhodobium orientis]RAI24281.1 precorrin-6A synthase (deacetylating) [Rhodobium orientis]